MLLRKAAGYLLMGAAVFLFTFWCYRFAAAAMTAFAEQGREGSEGPLALMMPALRLLGWTIAAAALYSLGGRLADPKRFEKQILVLARDALSRGDDGPPEEPSTDEVSALYENLPLEELVLVNSSIDSRRYRRRHHRLRAVMKERLLELETGGGEGEGGPQRGD